MTKNFFYPVLYGDEFLAFPEAGFPVTLEDCPNDLFNNFGYYQSFFCMFGCSVKTPELLPIYGKG